MQIQSSLRSVNSVNVLKCIRWGVVSKKHAQFVTQSMEGVFAQTDSEHHLGDKCLVLQQIA